jgi:hypothetical protein
MKTKIEKWRNYFFCQCQWIRFTAAALWCLFFVGAGPKAQSQQTQWPSNSLPQAASDASAEAALSSDTSTNLTSETPANPASTNEVQQVQEPVSSSRSPSGVMSYPAPSWSGQTISNSTSSVMAYPAPASPDSLNSKSSGVMAYPAPSWSGQTNSTPAAELSAPAAETPTATQPPPAIVEQPATAPAAEQPAAAPAPVAEQPSPAPAATTEQVAPATPPPATEAAPTAPAVSAEQPATPPPPASVSEQPAATTTEQAPAPSEGFSMSPPPMLKPPKSTKNEVSVSGDFLLGEGKVSLPFGYSLNQALKGTASSSQGVFTVPRNSVYYGGTLSYSYGQAWYIDLSYAQGHSSGSQSIATGFLGDINSTFSIDDTWYQLYLKYTFPQLRGKRFSAYLRAGASYITSTLKDDSTGASAGVYSQKDDTQDILGNIGAGLAYSLYTTHRLRVDLQGEIEGFGGERSQQSTESLPDDGLSGPQTDLSNTLYGGIGIATVRVEYRMGRGGLFKVFGEAGIEGRYTLIEYSGSNAGTPSEYLWGPYIKLGLRYSF